MPINYANLTKFLPCGGLNGSARNRVSGYVANKATTLLILNIDRVNVLHKITALNGRPGKLALVTRYGEIPTDKQAGQIQLVNGHNIAPVP